MCWIIESWKTCDELPEWGDLFPGQALDLLSHNSLDDKDTDSLRISSLSPR